MVESLELEDIRCEICGYAIEPDRLEALPQATRCLACARLAPALAA